ASAPPMHRPCLQGKTKHARPASTKPTSPPPCGVYSKQKRSTTNRTTSNHGNASTSPSNHEMGEMNEPGSKYFKGRVFSKWLNNDLDSRRIRRSDIEATLHTPASLAVHRHHCAAQH